MVLDLKVVLKNEIIVKNYERTYMKKLNKYIGVKLISILCIFSTILNASLIDDGYNEQKKGNLVQAAKIYEQACNKDDYDACSRLAYMNVNGKGIKVNKRKAVELYSKVCQKTNRKCDTLAWMYHEGEGVRQDKHKFIQLSKQACDHNDYVGCQFIGYAYRDGDIVKQNKPQAIQIFSSMCVMRTNNKFNKAIAQQSCIDAGFIYYNNGHASKSDIDLAKEYFGKGCDLGDSSACKNYKILNEQGFDANL